MTEPRGPGSTDGRDRDEGVTPLRVIALIQETPETKTIRLDNAEGRVAPQRAGQHVKLFVPGPGGPLVRSFTISSPPTRPGAIEVTVRRNPAGVVSNAVHALRLGDWVGVKGPSGRFTFDPDADLEPLALVVAGRGVTPAIAILRTLLDRGLDRSVDLFYGARTADDLLFATDMERMRRELAGFRVIVSLTRPPKGWVGESGRLGRLTLARHFDDADLLGRRFYLCGPGDLNEVLAGWLAGRGVPVDRILIERFGKPPRPSTGAAIATDPFARDGTALA